MTGYTFNLIDQPWIPCLTLGGKLVELSLRDLLAHAHELRAIHCETPIMSAAILPMTLALLHRVYGPSGRRQWRELWAQGQFPLAPLNDYLDTWYERFDLFHPEHPFYQAQDERVKPIPVMFLAEAIKHSPTLFNHKTPDLMPYLTASESARTLLAAHYFRVGGGISGKDTPNFVSGIWTNSVIFFAEGRSLFETLTLNLLRYPDEGLTGIPQSSDDKPIWERDTPRYELIKQIHKVTPSGYLDYLTWQTNNISLIPDNSQSGIIVKEIRMVPLAQLLTEVKSPQKRYIRKDKEDVTSWSFLYFSEQKALWRDYHTILPHDDDAVRPPAVVTWLSEIGLSEGYPLRLMATGMLADQAKVIFYRQEQMPLPVELLRNPDTLTLIEQATQRADQIADALRSALNLLAEQVLMRGGTEKPDSNDRKRLVEQWDGLGLYWEQLEAHFWTFIHALAADDDTALDVWEDVLKRASRDALAKVERMAGDSPWAIKGGVVANRKLQAEFNRIFDKR